MILLPVAASSNILEHLTILLKPYSLILFFLLRRSKKPNPCSNIQFLLLNNSLFFERMDVSQFMDKQIMDLTSSSTAHDLVSSSSLKPITSSSSRDFIDLMNPPQDDNQHHHNQQAQYNSNTSSNFGSVGDNGIRKEEIVPSYDFQPIRSVASSLDSSVVSLGAPTASSRVWNSAEFVSNSVRNSAALPIRVRVSVVSMHFVLIKLCVFCIYVVCPYNIWWSFKQCVYLLGDLDNSS